MNIVAHKLGSWLSRYLNRESKSNSVGLPTDINSVHRCVKVGDVILVEGHTQFSTAIKYLTQSTWSHAALYVGDITIKGKTYHNQVIEADITNGIIHTPLHHFRGYHTRICRPVGLSADSLNALKNFAISKLGGTYDLRNVFDLVRYLIPVLPFPAKHRRRLLSFGSGDPTKAICSTLVAEAFESQHYPILPKRSKSKHLKSLDHTLITPRDFDVSPYFQVVKPSLELGFDYHSFEWDQ